MGYEIDFLPVGEKSKSGDAIALRYGNLYGHRTEQTVIVIDGGYVDNGPELVNHIQTYFQTDHVDFVVSTHPEQDHMGGLKTVLEEMTVGHLLMHLPWNHSGAMAMAKAASFSNAGFNEALEAALQRSAELEDIARSKGIPITEPFAGVQTQDGCFRILGPSVDFYEELVGLETSPAPRSLSELLLKAASGLANLIPETYHHETLRDDGTTSPQNNC